MVHINPGSDDRHPIAAETYPNVEIIPAVRRDFFRGGVNFRSDARPAPPQGASFTRPYNQQRPISQPSRS
jgi:hypothetical protein